MMQSYLEQVFSFGWNHLEWILSQCQSVCWCAAVWLHTVWNHRLQCELWPAGLCYCVHLKRGMSGRHHLFLQVSDACLWLTAAFLLNCQYVFKKITVLTRRHMLVIFFTLQTGFLPICLTNLIMQKCQYTTKQEAYLALCLPSAKTNAFLEVSHVWKETKKTCSKGGATCARVCSVTWGEVSTPFKTSQRDGFQRCLYIKK